MILLLIILKFTIGYSKFQVGDNVKVICEVVKQLNTNVNLHIYSEAPNAEIENCFIK